MVTELKKAFEEIERTLAGWEYYEALNGQSEAATLFLFFLKWMSDCEAAKEQFDSDESFFYQFRGAEKQGYSELIQIFLDRLHRGRQDSCELPNQFLKRLRLEQLPDSFSDVLRTLEKYDFSNRSIHNSLVRCILLLYGRIYSEKSFDCSDTITCMYGMNVAAGLLNCGENMSIYDFSCGTGGLATLAALSAGAGSVVYGQERNFEKAVVAYLMLRIAGEDSEVYLEVGDVLQRPMTLNYPGTFFDRIIAAPPVESGMIYASKMTQNKYDAEYFYHYPELYSGFWIYASHMLKKMKTNGIGVLIAPISILSREGKLLRDRERLLCEGYIDSVIQMPSDFFDIAGKMCIIVLKKNREQERERVYLADFTSRAAENITKNPKNQEIDFRSNRIIQIVRKKVEIANVSVSLPIHVIIDQEMNLTPSIYVRNINEMVVRRGNTMDILDEHNTLLSRYHESEIEMERAIQDYYELWGNEYNRGEGRR